MTASLYYATDNPNSAFCNGISLLSLASHVFYFLVLGSGATIFLRLIYDLSAFAFHIVGAKLARNWRGTGKELTRNWRVVIHWHDGVLSQQVVRKRGLASCIPHCCSTFRVYLDYLQAQRAKPKLSETSCRCAFSRAGLAPSALLVVTFVAVPNLKVVNTVNGIEQLIFRQLDVRGPSRCIPPLTTSCLARLEPQPCLPYWQGGLRVPAPCHLHTTGTMTTIVIAVVESQSPSPNFPIPQSIYSK